jgi:putative MFS transporter
LPRFPEPVDAGLFAATLLCRWLADKFRRTMFTWSFLAYTGANTLMACQSTAFGLNS